MQFHAEAASAQALALTASWRQVLYGGEAADGVPVGQRLGLPYTRTLQEFIDVTLSAVATGTDAEGERVDAPAKVSICQDGTGLQAISGVVWDCGLLLADYLIHLRDTRSTQVDRVLDVGCGTGIGGIVALKLFNPTSLVFTDCCLTTTLETNLFAAQSPAVSFVKYSWGVGPTPLELRPSVPWDLVLCSDVLYDAKGHAPLLELLRSLAFTTVVFAYKRRHEEPEKQFFAAMEQFCTLTVVDTRLLSLPNLPAACLPALYLVLAQPKSAPLSSPPTAQTDTHNS